MHTLLVQDLQIVESLRIRRCRLSLTDISGGEQRMEGVCVEKEGRQTDAPTNPPAAGHDVRGGIKGKAELPSPLGDGVQGGDGYERGNHCLCCGSHCVKPDAAGICDECQGGVFRVQNAGREKATERGSEGEAGEGDGGRRGRRLVLYAVRLHACACACAMCVCVCVSCIC